MSICAMAANAGSCAIFVDLQSMSANPVLTSGVHVVRTFGSGHFHFVALNTVPDDTRVLCMRIAMARSALQASMSNGSLIGLAGVNGKRVIAGVPQITALVECAGKSKHALGVESGTHMAATAIGARDSSFVGTMATGTGKILGKSSGWKRYPKNNEAAEAESEPAQTAGILSDRTRSTAYSATADGFRSLSVTIHPGSPALTLPYTNSLSKSSILTLSPAVGPAAIVCRWRACRRRP